jgi:dihydroorotase
MPELDLVIRGGTVVTPGGAVDADVFVHDERIVGIASPEVTPSAARVINAAGKVVMPGLIDMHSHHREPGFTHKEDITTATRAAAAGGVTVTVGMPNISPPPNTLAIYRDTLKLYAAKAVVDYNLNPAGTVLDEIDRIAQDGQLLAFKVFMVVDTGRDYPHMPGIGVHDHGQLFAIFERVQRTGYPVMVHPHDQALMTYLEEQFFARGETDHRAYARCLASHDGVIWNTAIATLLSLQKATGVHLHLLHMNTIDTIEMVRRAKAEGRRVTCEVNPWALFLSNTWETIERLGPYALSYYVPPEHAERAWSALNDGTIDIIATDHAPHTREEKEVGWTNMWKTHSGTPHTQFYLSLLLHEVNRGRISLERAVEVVATAPARIFGLAPKKGAITVGADADLVVVDMKVKKRISNAEVLSKIGWTPYDGREVQGVPVMTILRGQVIVDNGKVISQPGFGRLAARARPPQPDRRAVPAGG